MSKRVIGNVNSSTRRPGGTGRRDVMSSTRTDPDISTVEIDNHADTTCAGENCVPLCHTGQVCNVQPFSGDCDAKKDVLIEGVATVCDDPRTGESILLEPHEVLVFTDSLDHTPLNPNQARYFGHSLCDDPFDPHRELESKFDETNDVMPFEQKGLVICFETWRPTQEELHQLRRLVVTGDTPWDPSSISLTHKSASQEEFDRMASEVQVSQVRRKAPWMDNGKQTLADSEFDVVMRCISSGYSDRTLIPRLISQVQVGSCDLLPEDSVDRAAVKVPKRVFTVRSDERHFKASPDALFRKWNIGLEAARNTSRVTTQVGVRTAVRPITRRFRTDMMTLKYRRLNTTIHSDTMMSNVKSLKGNVCAQVFATENFVVVDPIPSKADAGKALKRFADDVGAPQVMVFDNAQEQLGKNSDFQKTLDYIKTD